MIERLVGGEEKWLAKEKRKREEGEQVDVRDGEGEGEVGNER